MPSKPYVKGVENIPIRQIITSFPIVAFIINLSNNDEIVDQIEIDYSKIEDKKHLGRITYWALANGYSIELMNKKDVEAEFIKDVK